jgi:hypothetical protein
VSSLDTGSLLSTGRLWAGIPNSSAKLIPLMGISAQRKSGPSSQSGFKEGDGVSQVSEFDENTDAVELSQAKPGWPRAVAKMLLVVPVAPCHQPNNST